MGTRGAFPVLGDLGTSGHLDGFRDLFSLMVLTSGDLGSFQNLAAVEDLIALGDLETLGDIVSVQGLEAFVNLLTCWRVRCLEIWMQRERVGGFGGLSFLDWPDLLGDLQALVDSEVYWGVTLLEYLPEPENQETSRLLHLARTPPSVSQILNLWGLSGYSKYGLVDLARACTPKCPQDRPKTESSFSRAFQEKPEKQNKTKTRARKPGPG